MKTRAIICALALVMCQLEAKAGFIDFETGYVTLDPVSSINTGDNTVGVQLGNGIGGPAYIADILGDRTSFTSNIGPDNVVGGNPGQFFLNDENVVDIGTRAANYLFDFDLPILNLSLDVYDFRGDGGGSVGDTATLTLFSDAAMANAIGSASFVIPALQPVDGNVFTLSVNNPNGFAVAALLDLGGLDRGVGVDNISFETLEEGPGPNPVPEPSTLVLFGMGSLGLLGFGYRRKKAAKA